MGNPALFFMQDNKMRAGKRPAKRKKRRWWKIILAVFFLLLVSTTVFAYQKIHPIYVDTQKNIYQILSSMNEGSFRREGNTYVFDKDGHKIGKIGNENYAYVESADISPYIKNGYIAQEDKNFATHHGVDFKALFRAGIAYVKNRGVITQGGSTITQQTIKNNLLSSERTFSRKITEALLAFEVEKTYTKAQIMEFYCNSNYYGNGCYGVEGAAQYYFGKSAKDVTLAEAAMIVGTSNRPNDYNPEASYEKAMKKKEEVLKNMLKEKLISQKEYEQALKEKPLVVAKGDKTDNDNYMVSYAVHCATLRLMEMQGFQFRYSFSSKKEYKKYEDAYSKLYSECSDTIRSGGYKIYTSFDTKIQKQMQDTVSSVLADHKELQGAAVCIDNQTQMIVAIVGGKSEKDEYNRAFLAERNPGSSIKPLLDYGPAINEGVITPASVIKDEPIDFNGYSPKNSSGTYLGDVTAREALARSINTVAVKLFRMTGNDICFSYLTDMRFSSLSFADSTISSIALGGMTYGVKPVDMAKGYSTLANGGKYSDNDCVLRLEREDGSIVFQANNNETEVYTADTAFILTDMLQGVFREEYGTAHDLYQKGRIYAGKTGTTDDNKDAWFCGYSTDYTTSVWVGCDTPKSIEGLTGSSYPADIFVSFMNTITDASSDFTPPETVYLFNENGDTKTLPSGNDCYASRPSGYDYGSSLNDERREEYLLEQRIEKEKESAEKKVSDFESFTIKNTSDAKKIDEKYNEVLNVISQIEDTAEQAPYKERAAYQYSLLQKAFDKEWKQAIEVEEDAALKKQQLDQAKETAESEELALETMINKKKDVVKWYIDALYDRQVYGTGTKQMITDANKALQECESYDGYEALKADLDDAIAYASALPTKEELQEEENAISYPDASAYPDDIDTTDTETTAPSYSSP